MIFVKPYAKYYSELLICSMSLRDKFYYYTILPTRNMTWSKWVGELSKMPSLAGKRYLSEIEAMPPIFNELNTAPPASCVSKREAGLDLP